MRPADRVLGRFGGHEAAVGELDPRDGPSRLERHAQARRAGWHGCVPRFAPCDLDEAWPLDADVVPANQNTVDVDRKESAVLGLEACDVAHPAYEQLRLNEVVEDAFRRRLDVDARPKRLAHGLPSISRFIAASLPPQNDSTNAATGAKPSGLIE
jgi:hypothetical protein